VTDEPPTRERDYTDDEIDEDEGGEFAESALFDDFGDHDFDDYYDDVGDEDEDSYGDDVAAA
jgi:hypothetical protein